jgi:hypothetical protein
MHRPVRFAWAFRISLLLLWVWATRNPPSPLTVIDPLQQVVTHNPKIGVHTRLTDEAAEWKIQRTWRMAREMGASWAVEFFPWINIEPVKGQFFWDHSDAVIDHAASQSIRVIARLGLVPTWARPDPREQETTFNYIDAEHYDDFGDFVYAFVDRYRGRVNHIIIWNEPNLSFEWGLRPVSARQYIDLLRVAHARAKQADPNVVVLAGALAPTREPEGSPAGLSDLIYLRQMYDAGAAEYFDALAVHVYGLTTPMHEAPDPDRVNFRRVELLREIMVESGDEAKQVYITESGWNDSPRWGNAVSPAQRIEYTIDAYEWAVDQPWVEMLAMWAFRFPQSANTYQDNWTWVNEDFSPKPIYLEVQKYATGR